MKVTQKYTPSEISLHSTKKDCWLVIHGKVYDVTTFLEDHPGGEDVLLHASGSGDATESFEEVGHSSTATSMMEGYLIGTVEGQVNASDSTGAPKPPAGGRAARNKALLENKQAPSSSFTDYLLPLLVLALAFGSWYYLTFINKE